MSVMPARDRRTRAADRARQTRRWLLVTLLALLAGVLVAGPGLTPPDARAQDAPGSAGQSTPSPNTQPGATQPATSGGPGSSGGATLASGANVAVIRIEGMIHGYTRDDIERRMERAKEQGASVVVIELHTNGGVVDSALNISKFIKQQTNVYTIAWVNNKAYSAGIMIASACDQMVMSTAAQTGDCAPIVPGQEVAPSERAKALSPILAEFRDSARRNNYDYAPFHAMCVLGVEVYYIENPDTGERRLVNQADYMVMVDGMTIDQANRQVKSQARGGLGGLFSPQAQQEARWDIAVPTADVATSADQGQWEPITTMPLPGGRTQNFPNGQIHSGRELFTVDNDVAQFIGLSNATVDNDSQLGQQLQAASVTRIEPTWSESMVAFLVHPMVRGVLVIALLLGAYIEFQTPGIGIGGAVAAAALVTLLGAPFLVGLAEVWHVVVFFIGLVLLIVEFAVLPGFGVFGVSGLILMFAGLVLTAVPSGGNMPGLPPMRFWGLIVESAIFLMIGLFAGLGGMYFVARHFGNVPILNRLVLKTEQQRAVTSIESASATVGAAGSATGSGAAMPASGDEALGEGHVNVGATGTVTTGLRPSGRAEINGQIVDVVSLGEWITPGQSIRVAEVHGNRIVVEKA